jgi:PAS domain S-box-containing protein
MRNGREKHSVEESGPVSPSEAEAILKGLASMYAPFESATRQLDSESINRRKMATTTEEVLLSVDARYQTLVEQIPAVIFMAFLDRGISEAYISPQIESILGFSQQEWLNDPVRWYNQIHPDDRVRWSTEAAGLFISGKPLQSTYRIMARAGHVVWFRCEAKMVRHDDGRPWFIHGVAFDISDLKRSEESLKKAHDELEMRVQQRTAAEQKARAEAEVANRLKDEFLATVSHELRTPLHTMFGWVQLLRSGGLDGINTQHAVEVIERNLRLQRQIVDDILDVSHIITGKLRIETAPVELSLVIEAAVDSMHPAADAKGINLQVVFDPKANIVFGDAGRLQQVVWNLISNAIRFTPQEGCVQIRTEHKGSQVEIKVIDTGSGIKPEFLPHVFDRFRQEDSSITRAQGGLGLGLSIVRHIVELHGGTVMAENRSDAQGAIFTVRLPLAVAGESKTTPHVTRIGPPPNKDMTPKRTSTLTGLKVLLVDDDADGRKMITTFLEKNGAQVRAAAAANEALQTFTEWRPDVLVSDIGMPGEDGYSLIRKIRALPPELGGNVPAAALTGYAGRADYLKAISAGYQSHIKKPVELEELIAVVASLVGRTVLMSRSRIIVADDSEDMLNLLKDILEPEFEVVATVWDGRDLLQAVDNLKPDVIIADINMPEMSGIEATRRIVEEDPGAKIILLTIHSDRTIAEEGISAGAKGYVSKLAADRELGPAINDVIQGRIYISPLVKQ